MNLIGRTVLVTGGAGFIGSSVADRAATSGARVVVFADLSRTGVATNLEWLVARHGDRIEVQIADVRDPAAVDAAVASADHVFHLAAQVAPATGLEDPVGDFDVNARGTLNVLEAMRRHDDPPSLLYASTYRVYGQLSDVALACVGERYTPMDDAVRDHGVSEARPLDFHSSLGCSKGAADQYVLEYARTYGAPAVVFRMSCVYGPRQRETEDQGWVTHFLIRAIEHDEIMIYGDGRQVRDILFVDDLVDAMFQAHESVDHLAGSAFNIGGGPERIVSPVELLAMIGALRGESPRVVHAGWRPDDQRYYVSDTSSFRRATGWSPRVDVFEGVSRLAEWLASERAATARLRRSA